MKLLHLNARPPLFILSLSLILLMLAACNGESDSPSNASPTPPPSNFNATVVFGDRNINLTGSGTFTCENAREALNPRGGQIRQPAHYILANQSLSNSNNMLIFRIPANIRPGQYPVYAVADRDALVGEVVTALLTLEPSDGVFNSNGSGTITIQSVARAPGQTMQARFEFSITRPPARVATVTGEFNFVGGTGPDLYCTP